MRTPITYYGGKQMLAKLIISLLPDHKIYCEPYFGGGAVFFEKRKSYLEVINDVDDRLITFYTVLQNNYTGLHNLIQHSIHSESLYKTAKRIYKEKEFASDLEMAWAIWMLTNCSFLGTPQGGWKWCNGSAGSHSGIVLNNKRALVSQKLHERIKDAQISSRNAIRVITDRDTSETVYYLDPPYVSTDQKHYSGFTIKDLIELLDLIQEIKGFFILSNFWSQTLRYYVLKNNWYVITIDSHMKVSNLRIRSNKPKKVKSKTEILVMNFIPEAANQYKLEFTD